MSCKAPSVITCIDKCKPVLGALEPCRPDPCDDSLPGICDPALGLSCLLNTVTNDFRCVRGRDVLQSCTGSLRAVGFNDCNVPLFCRNTSCGLQAPLCGVSGGIGAPCDSDWNAPGCSACEPGLVCVPHFTADLPGTRQGYCQKPCPSGAKDCPCNQSFECSGADGRKSPTCCMSEGKACDATGQCCSAEDVCHVEFGQAKGTCKRCTPQLVTGCTQNADCCPVPSSASGLPSNIICDADPANGQSHGHEGGGPGGCCRPRGFGDRCNTTTDCGSGQGSFFSCEKGLCTGSPSDPGCGGRYQCRAPSPPGGGGGTDAGTGTCTRDKRAGCETGPACCSGKNNTLCKNNECACADLFTPCNPDNNDCCQEDDRCREFGCVCTTQAGFPQGGTFCFPATGP